MRGSGRVGRSAAGRNLEEQALELAVAAWIRHRWTEYDELIQYYGGSPGLHDAGLLEAALAMPQAGFGGQYFHEFPHEMGAAYLFHLVRNHAFIDGNKRVALACAILFFKINRVTYSITEDEAVELTYDAASGQRRKDDVTEFFRRHLKTHQDPD